jgi:hypothetical protein
MLKKCLLVLYSPIFLLLNDVDHEDQVYALFPITDKGILPIPLNNFVLITSRDRKILTSSGVQESSIYKLFGLDT